MQLCLLPRVSPPPHLLRCQLILLSPSRHKVITIATTCPLLWFLYISSGIQLSVTQSNQLGENASRPFLKVKEKIRLQRKCHSPPIVAPIHSQYICCHLYTLWGKVFISPKHHELKKTSQHPACSTTDQPTDIMAKWIAKDSRLILLRASPMFSMPVLLHSTSRYHEAKL